MTVSVWNAVKKELEPISWSQMTAELPEPVDQYLIGGMTLRLVISTQDWTGFDLPEISVKGSSSR
ncbi:hypothetical protein D3C77_696060 [compost metagenome]